MTYEVNHIISNPILLTSNQPINIADITGTQLEYLYDPGDVFEVTAFNFIVNKHLFRLLPSEEHSINDSARNEKGFCNQKV